MAIGKQKKNPESVSEAVSVPQTGNKTHPFSRLGSFFPQPEGDIRLFSDLRQAVPVIDAAVMKLVRLLGSFTVSCDNERAQRELSQFLSEVPVGGTGRGIDCFISTFFEELITYGTAVGEMIFDGREITNLYNAPLKNIALAESEAGPGVVVCADNGKGSFAPVKYPALILLATHAPEPGKLYGTSVLKGLPFISDILLKIYNTLGVNWERLGNVRFAVTYKPQNDAIDKAYAKERTLQLANEWSRTMESGSVRDFVALGDVSIKAIGSDIQLLSSEVPVRQLLEQIVAKLGIPPFLLGLSWSTTERMSYQQADILTTEIEAYRREITPTVRKICSTWLSLKGYDCPFEVQWDDVTMQDAGEIAKSNYYNAMAMKAVETKGDEIDGNS